MRLALLAPPMVGGWPTFAGHLAIGLTQAGRTPQIVRPGKRDENRERLFRSGMKYRNVGPGSLLERANDTLIVSATARQAQLVADLRAKGAGIVIHDPTELKGDMDKAIHTGGPPPIVIRRSMLRYIPGAVFIPHPYAQHTIQRRRQWLATAISRIDWDKHTLAIVQANTELPPGDQVAIFGSENRMYAHHKLDSTVPGWRSNYHGAFPKDDLWGGARVAAQGDYMVDMSVIKGDGGGTQYTHLEAANAGATLILSRDWLTGDPDMDEIAQYAHCVEPRDLGQVLQSRPTTLNVDALLRNHEARRVANMVVTACSA